MASEPQSGNRSSHIDDLIAKQDHVIKELDELDVRLLATIEKFKAAKKEAAESQVIDQNQPENPASKAA